MVSICDNNLSGLHMCNTTAIQFFYKFYAKRTVSVVRTSAIPLVQVGQWVGIMRVAILPESCRVVLQGWATHCAVQLQYKKTIPVLHLYCTCADHFTPDAYTMQTSSNPLYSAEQDSKYFLLNCNLCSSF